MKRILLIAAFTLSLGALTSAQVITNGSFEETGCSLGYYETFFPGSDMVGWVVGQGYITLWCDHVRAAHGDVSAHLSGGSGSPSSAYQDVPTLPGIVYRVTFDMSGFGLPVKTMTVSADNAQAANYAYTDLGNTGYDMNWSTQAYSFTAADASTRLMFTSTTDGYQGPFIDNVAAVAIAGAICHTNNGSGTPRTLTVNEGAFWGHTNHGDQIGACP